MLQEKQSAVNAAELSKEGDGEISVEAYQAALTHIQEHESDEGGSESDSGVELEEEEDDDEDDDDFAKPKSARSAEKSRTSGATPPSGASKKKKTPTSGASVKKKQRTDDGANASATTPRAKKTLKDPAAALKALENEARAKQKLQDVKDLQQEVKTKTGRQEFASARVEACCTGNTGKCSNAWCPKCVPQCSIVIGGTRTPPCDLVKPYAGATGLLTQSKVSKMKISIDGNAVRLEVAPKSAIEHGTSKNECQKFITGAAVRTPSYWHMHVNAFAPCNTTHALNCSCVLPPGPRLA